jgi:hypothetical protein
MHNMTVKEERVNSVYDQESDFQSELIEPWGGPSVFQEFLPCASQNSWSDQATHFQLQNDLVEHITTLETNSPRVTFYLIFVKYCV